MYLINDDSQQIIFDILVRSKNPIIVTDSPFNINYHYNTYNDNLKEDEYLEGLCSILKYSPFVLIHYPEMLYKISFEIEKFPKRIISWVYNSNTQRQHRDIAFFDINPIMKQVRQPYKNLKDKRIKERIAKGEKGAKLYDWWEINQVKNVSKEKTKHPCQMPLEVMKRIIGILPYNCTIIDPFMGSGTTGLAVQEMNQEQGAKREFIGIEIDEEYFNIAKERIYENDI